MCEGQHLGRGQLSGVLSAPLVISIPQRGTGTRNVIRDKQRAGTKAKACVMAPHKVHGMSRAGCLEAPRGRTASGLSNQPGPVSWDMQVATASTVIAAPADRD